MKVYLAGPMSGVPQFNIPKFFEVATRLRDHEGFDVINPAELDEDSGLLVASLKNLTGDPKLTDGFSNGHDDKGTWAAVLARDVHIILSEVDGIVLLPGWEGSKGARIEAFCAVTIGLEIFLWDPKNNETYFGSTEYVLETLANG